MDPMTHAAPTTARRPGWPRRLAWIVLAPPLAGLLAVLGARALPPSAEGQAAREQLQARLSQRAPVEDGFALLYFAWRPDLPRAGLEAALAEVVERDRALLEQARREGRLITLPTGPAMPEDAAALATCLPGCLADAAPGGRFAALAERHAEALARLQDALRAPDPIGPGRSDGLTGPPDLIGLRALVGLRAVAWRAGHRDEALEASCLDLQAAERMAMAHPDDGVEAMVGINQYQLTAYQLSMMLAEAPGVPLPPACEALLAPPVHAPADALCRIVEGEFGWQEASLEAPVVMGRAHMRGLDERWEASLRAVESTPHALGAAALEVEWACSPLVAEAMRAGRLDVALREASWREQLASPLDAWAPEAWAGWHPYRARLLGFDAVRRALGARLHLHLHQHGVEGEDGLATAPAWTRSSSAPLRIEPGALSVDLPGSALGGGGPFSLPMPQAPEPRDGDGEAAP